MNNGTVCDTRRHGAFTFSRNVCNLSDNAECGLPWLHQEAEAPADAHATRTGRGNAQISGRPVAWNLCHATRQRRRVSPTRPYWDAEIADAVVYSWILAR